MAGNRNGPTAPGNGGEHTISTKILDAGVNEEQAWAHVAGWIGPEGHPRRWVEDWLSVVFHFEQDALRAEAAHGGRPYELTWDPDGTPRLRLLEPRDEEDVLARLAERKQGAPEAVVEKATSRVVKSLLGLEWRDPEELALERAAAGRADLPGRSSRSSRSPCALTAVPG
jgi:hypothetical protein